MSEMTLEQAASKYDEYLHHIGGCTDGACVIVRPKGMHTNGGCRCWRDPMKMQRMAHAAMNLRSAIDAHLAATKAQTVDIEAVREVLGVLRKAGRYDIYGTDQQACDLADKLADALPKDQ